ncbi:MAG: iron-sulfur cluster-binding protein [Phycisphaerales bacterium]|nr:iron-sulfur cluster-binding protein [Phycisphaerales bacterium]
MSAAPQAAGDHPLHVQLPYDMRPRAGKAIGDVQLQQFVGSATSGKDRGRRQIFAETFGERADEIRRLAGAIKQHTLDHLDWYLDRFIDAAEKAGVLVHLASTAEQANAICVRLAKERGCKLCVKSKSMVTEETELVPRLEAAGIETVETDLGEFIIQLDHDAPSHIVTPMIHKDRTAVGRAFARELGVPYTDDPLKLARIARDHLRQKYRKADLGISGANFLIAETGSIVLCTNEGNGRFCTSAPSTHIAIAGIEKLVPRMEHLGVMLKVLARSATAQPLTCYTHIITGPRGHDTGEHDGPTSLHLILLDNGRTEILREETRELLRCIRCGACLNACPVYRKVGGHSYGSVYSGPIGAVITPLLKGLENYPDLPQATPLCGACHEACPVKIDLPKQLIGLRRRMAERGVTSLWERLGYRAWGLSLRWGWSYRLAASVQRWVLRRLASRAGSPAGGDRIVSRGWLSRGPGPLAGWTSQRDFPTPTATSFREWWKARGGQT